MRLVVVVVHVGEVAAVHGLAALGAIVKAAGVGRAFWLDRVEHCRNIVRQQRGLGSNHAALW